jgi:hypothetical protein
VAGEELVRNGTLVHAIDDDVAAMRGAAAALRPFAGSA